MADETTLQEAALRERIEITRNHMGDTIEEIANHLNPDRLKREFRAGLREQVEETKDAIRGATIGKAKGIMHNMERSSSETGRTLMDTVRENPIPATMVAVGLGWLLAETRNHRHHHYTDDTYQRTYRDTGYGESRYAGAAYDRDVQVPLRRTSPGYGVHSTGEQYYDEKPGVKDQLRETSERARERASEATERVRERTTETTDHLMHATEERLHHLGERTHDVQMRTKQRAKENPLAAGTAALALGFAAGMFLPETEREREVMGPVRDRLVERTHDTVENMESKVKRVAAEAVEDITEHAKSTVKEASKEVMS